MNVMDMAPAAEPVIILRYASVEAHDWGCTSRFLDGTSVPAVPHPWDHCYSVIAHRCGYGFDQWRYCIEHEIAHHVVSEFLLDRPSPILWGLAHDKPIPAHEAAYEELMAQSLQRFARAAERPIIGGVDWSAMRHRFLEVVP